MAEFITMQEAEDKFGKKGVAGAGLGLGIAGTALGLLNGNGGGLLSGLFGGSAAGNQLHSLPSIWEICEKQNEKNVALTSAIYEARLKQIEDLNGVYQAVNSRLVELEKKDAAAQASMPLMFQLAQVNAERYADSRVNNAERQQNDVNFIFQRDLDKKINGTIGLPWGDIITGIPTMPACTMGVTCPTATTA